MKRPFTLGCIFPFSTTSIFERQRFEHLENSDQPDAYSDLKMAELYKLRNDIQLMLDRAEKNGLLLDIKASLRVSFISNDGSEETPA